MGGLLLWGLCGCAASPSSMAPPADTRPPQTPSAPARIHGPEGDSPTAAHWRGEHLTMREVQPGLFVTALVGDLAAPGVYVLRVKLLPHARLAPHTHPDGRLTTVLSGRVHHGRSDPRGQETAVTFGPGDAYYTPPNTPHWQSAGAEGAVYEETGFGPSAMAPVERPAP